jgi:putative acetyltransferase
LCFAFGEHQGKTAFYLETTAKLNQAVALYEKLGFAHLDKPLGNTGHSAACEIYMHKKI